MRSNQLLSTAYRPIANDNMSVTILKAAWASYALGSLWVFNNVWGAGGLVNGIDYTQSIAVDSATFPAGLTLSWTWPKRNSVLAYPEIIYGTQQTRSAPPGVAVPPPTQVAAFTDLSARYSISMSGQVANYDIAFDIWLTSQPNDGIQDELIVFAHNPWGTVKGATQIATLDHFGVYMSPNWGNGAQKWRFITVVPGSDRLSGTISFSDIFKALIWNNVLTGKEYTSGIELGAEVAGGAGSITINNLDYQWNANPVAKGLARSDILNIVRQGGNYIVGNGELYKVVYNDSYSKFQIKRSASELLVMKNNKIAELDVLDNVRYVEFSDGLYDVASSSFTPTPPDHLGSHAE
jgi:hypothetical protein